MGNVMADMLSVSVMEQVNFSFTPPAKFKFCLRNVILPILAENKSTTSAKIKFHCESK